MKGLKVNKQPKKPYVIIIGNEKGGTGKSTISMHLIIQILRLGNTVGSIDVDARQGTLSRYIENRVNYVKTTHRELPCPTHFPIQKSLLNSRDEIEEDEKTRFNEAIDALQDHDFILVDTPGTDSHLSRLAHSYADLLITPLNDSFIDLDMLARITQDTGEIIRPSTYAEMAWEQKKRRVMRDGHSFEWIVMRNRLSNLNAKNKQQMYEILTKLSQRIGFKLADGFGERVIFRELFLSGLTLLDLKDVGMRLSLSHVAARQELRNLIKLIALPEIQEQLTAQAA